ncbi:hypothetical protein SAMN04487943_11522 [Gracilibacillus orientalis]|uniref:DUF1617 family protein n=1 Tax=Gracilibacillus orientalis TaxID=334253 RepID=A0A1I4Q8A9_9BACI|nr:hypothetical protein [Gracilibacillus orientalis]SFM36322.1 hypothetical protein SAMN04487943_11522 [Gracilibacillus orientalis]
MIKLQNKHLKDVADFLQNNVGAKGKKNIHRMRIVKALQEGNNKLAEEEVALLKEYAKTDEQGELVTNEKGGFDVDDKKGFNEQHKELFDEEYVIDDKNLESAVKTVENLTNDYDKELIGKSAEAHFLLAESIENVEGGEEE